MKKVGLLLSGVLTGAGAAHAQDVTVEIELPRIRTAEYHRPYVAVWVSHPNQKIAANLSVWYQLTDGPEGHGDTWLKDLRQWWRRTGRTLDMPVDGISTATRAPGMHALNFSDGDKLLAELEDGDYLLHVEVSREVGGLERVSIPFSWGAGKATNESASGDEEIGAVSLKISPKP